MVLNPAELITGTVSFYSQKIRRQQKNRWRRTPSPSYLRSKPRTLNRNRGNFPEASRKKKSPSSRIRLDIEGCCGSRESIERSCRGGCSHPPRQLVSQNQKLDQFPVVVWMARVSANGACSDPKIQTLPGDGTTPENRTSPTKLPLVGLGLGTTFQLFPSQCNTRVLNWPEPSAAK